MIQWLQGIDTGPWAALGAAYREGLPVPTGFVVEPKTPEQEIRAAYEELKRGERTHFVALRSASHALLDILGNDAVIHSIRRLWAETPDAPILIQRMVNAEWCGTAARNPKNLLLHIKANEGMLLLDPDSYVLNRSTGKCTRRSLQKDQRKMVRWVDGTSRTVQADSRQTGLNADQLKAIAKLVESAQADVTWALDDRRVWLISITRP
jgi:phosphoenolpyruvate synthase/pyruvate phosphate dikinase